MAPKWHTICINLSQENECLNLSAILFPIIITSPDVNLRAISVIAYHYLNRNNPRHYSHQTHLEAVAANFNFDESLKKSKAFYPKNHSRLKSPSHMFSMYPSP